MVNPAILALADGSVFEGISIGADGSVVGEIVFNTSMTGYQEMVSDPSYAEQIITLTYPHIGNVGCNLEDMESDEIWAKGLVVRDSSMVASNYRSECSLGDWLKLKKIVAIADIDTRHLTQLLRDKGAQAACISTETDEPEKAIAKAREFASLQGKDLAQVVTTEKVKQWQEGRGEWGSREADKRYNIVAYDFGVKKTILRILADKGCDITLVPAKMPVEDVLALNPDGVFLSNGPGDPAACDYAIDNIKVLLNKKVPLFGICLGFQLLALASGAQSLKMKFGHHGGNHPVIDAKSKRVFITSQNHGFAIDEDTLPEQLEVTHRSLFDKSLQGIQHKTQPAFGFQGHPEASPGPHDIEELFDRFIAAMASGE